MQWEKVKRALLFFLPTLVFLTAFTAPGGEYVFGSGTLGEVVVGPLPPYVGVANRTLYLYSSPYGPWPYPNAIELKLFYPAQVYLSSTCGAVAPGYLGGPPGVYSVNLTIPPDFQGTCWVNFTHPSGWRVAVELRVKPVDWYPGASERAVVKLNGSGWQFVQVGQDGTFYVWEKPYLRLPAAGCVFMYNGSVLMGETAHYAQIYSGVLPPVVVPAASGAERYGAFVYLHGVATLYVYGAPCVSTGSVPVEGPPPLAAEIGVLRPGYYGPVFDTPSRSNSTIYRTALRVINYTTASADLYGLYLYTYSTPVGMWGAVLRFNFAITTLLTTEVSFFKPLGASGPERVGNYWVYRSNGTVYWVGGYEPYYTCNPPCGLPSGWIPPIYVVADPTGQWGGWPQVLSVKAEALRPWGP
ncbi:MAG: hypothetical protein ABWJ97_04680 [Thermoproteus sp.]